MDVPVEGRCVRHTHTSSHDTRDALQAPSPRRTALAPSSACSCAKTTATWTQASSSSASRPSTPSSAKESNTRETSERDAWPCATRSGGGKRSDVAHWEQMQSTSCSSPDAYDRSLKAALTAFRSPCDSHTVLAAKRMASRSKRSSASFGCACAAATSARLASPLALPSLGSGAPAERRRSAKASFHRLVASTDDARTAQPRTAMPIACRKASLTTSMDVPGGPGTSPSLLLRERNRDGARETRARNEPLVSRRNPPARSSLPRPWSPTKESPARGRNGDGPTKGPMARKQNRPSSPVPMACDGARNVWTLGTPPDPTQNDIPGSNPHG
eukprot:scaffold80_cov325-Pavlova_lutheri.AAC.17